MRIPPNKVATKPIATLKYRNPNDSISFSLPYGPPKLPRKFKLYRFRQTYAQTESIELTRDELSLFCWPI